MWPIKPILFLILFALCNGTSIAQSNTFLKFFDAPSVSDIAEDEKKCFTAIIGDVIVRLNLTGETLWENHNYWGLWNIKLPTAHPDRYDYFGVGGELGGFAMLSLDNRGNQTRYVFKDPLLEKDTSRSPGSVYFDKTRNQYIVGGAKYSFRNPFQYWIAGFDTAGKMLWENSFYDKGKSRYFKQILPNKKNRGYLLVAGEEGESYYDEIFTTDSLGRVLTRSFVEKTDCNGSYELTLIPDIDIYNDSQFIASGIRYNCNPGLYVYILNSKGKVDRIISTDYLINDLVPLKNGDFLTAAGNTIYRFNSAFKLMWKRNLFPEPMPRIIEIREVYQSRDGGFYGVAYGQTNIPYANYAYAFKTDSLGRIFNNAGYSEWQQPMMLQPNPAQGKVRIAIPWYYGTIEAQFYNLQGQFLFAQTRNEQDAFDISTLSAGMYLVKARNPATGESRTMKLMVE